MSSVAQLCPTLCDPKDYSDPESLGSRTAACQASLCITNSRSLLKLMSIESMMPSNHLILSRPLLLLPSIFPSIRVFSKESVFTSGGQNSGVSALATVRLLCLGWPFCILAACGSSLLWRFLTVAGVLQAASQGFLVREACVHVLVGGAGFLSGVE